MFSLFHKRSFALATNIILANLWTGSREGGISAIARGARIGEQAVAPCLRIWKRLSFDFQKDEQTLPEAQRTQALLL